MSNTALVIVISILLLTFSKDPPSGFTVAEIGLMAGFSLFGKNIVNIWPIILGSFLHAKFQRVPFRTHVSTALLGTALSPAVSYFTSDNGWGGPLSGILIGILIGFLLQPVAAFTSRIQNGLNLYNMGFSCGLMAIVLAAVMNSLGAEMEMAEHWATGFNLPLCIYLLLLCVVLVISGLFFAGQKTTSAWKNYVKLLRTSGRVPNDYLQKFGSAPVLINSGVNGLICIAVIQLTGGELNGPILGGIFTVMAYSAYGKHARNIVPVMVGVFLSSVVLGWPISENQMQLMLLFSTTLAPVSGYFGWPFGLLVGFLHAVVVRYTGTVVDGLNLYNNGFSGGLIAMVLGPLISTIFSRRKSSEQIEGGDELLEENTPANYIYVKYLKKHRKGNN